MDVDGFPGEPCRIDDGFFDIVPSHPRCLFQREFVYLETVDSSDDTAPAKQDLRRTKIAVLR